MYILLLLFIVTTTSCEKQQVNVQTVQSQQNSDNVNTLPPLQNFVMEDSFTEVQTTEKKVIELPILFSHNKFYGYLDRQLQIIIPPIYTRGFDYTDHGYALVSYTDENGLRELRILDTEGNIMVKENNDDINLIYDDIISYSRNGGLSAKTVRFRDNKLIADVLGSSASVVENDIIILARFSPASERGFINSAGKRILPDLELRRMSSGFCEDRAVIYEGENWDIRIIDIDGNFYGSLDFLRTESYFSEGLLPAETKDGQTGYVNRDGEFAFLVPIVNYGDYRLYATDFNGGYAVIMTISDTSVWRIINNQGEYVSDELQLHWASSFRDGLSRVRLLNYKYMFINTKGEPLLDLLFDDAFSFHNGYARIVYEGRDGLINTEGTIFWSDEIVKAQDWE